MESINVYVEAGYLIKEVQHQVRKQMDKALLMLDITTPQYAALTRLKEFPGLSNADLAVRCFVTPQTMNLIVQKLEERDFVTRTKSQTHGKIINMELTGRGEEVLARANDLIIVVETEIFGRLSTLEIETLVCTLQKLRNA